MSIRQTVAVLVLALAATTVWAQMTVTQSGTAPTDNVVISQASAVGSNPFRLQSGRRDVGQTFPGGFVLDKITVRLNSVQNGDDDGDSFELRLYEYSNATDYTPDATTATLTGNLPASFKSNFDGGQVYLTFDLTTDVTLSGGQQYGFYLYPTFAAPHANILLDSAPTANFASGIGVIHGPAEMSYWSGGPVPADLLFYLQEAPAAGAIEWSNPGESNVTAVSAWGYATVSNDLTGAVLVWDTTDQGTVSTNDWPNRVALGGWSADDTVTGQMTGLLEKTQYAWRFYGYDATTNGWLASQTFTTADITAPSIQTLSPTNGATNVATTADLVATFDETVEAGSSGSITIKKSSDNSTVESFDVTSSPRLTWGGADVTIDPTADLAANTGYYVEIDAGAIQDPSTNAFAGISGSGTWSFTPRDVLNSSMSAAAPAGVLVISQTAAAHSTPLRWTRPAGTDRNPRDAGQSFLVGAEGLVLDKITVNIATLATAGYDSQPVTVEIFTLSGASDFTPDSTVATEIGNFASNMKAAFDGGDTYLTLDIPDVTLSAGQQYGFLLMHGAEQSTADNMLLAAQASSGYTAGIGITREQRGTGGDNYMETMVWTGVSEPADLEFYLYDARTPPSGTLFIIK